MAPPLEDDNDPYCSIDDALLKKYDWRILKSRTVFFTDVIIQFFLEYLRYRIYEDHEKLYFMPPSFVQWMKTANEDVWHGKDGIVDGLEKENAVERDVIVMPVNNSDGSEDDGVHWSLVVYRRSVNTYYTCDSSANSNKDSSDEVIKRMNRFLSDARPQDDPVNEHGVVEMKVTQQGNGHECGAHVCVNAEVLVHHFMTERPDTEAMAMTPEEVVDNTRARILDICDDLKKEATDNIKAPSKGPALAGPLPWDATVRIVKAVALVRRKISTSGAAEGLETGRVVPEFLNYPPLPHPGDERPKNLELQPHGEGSPSKRQKEDLPKSADSDTSCQK